MYKMFIIRGLPLSFANLHPRLLIKRLVFCSDDHWWTHINCMLSNLYSNDGYFNCLQTKDVDK